MKNRKTIFVIGFVFLISSLGFGARAQDKDSKKVDTNTQGKYSKELPTAGTYKNPPPNLNVPPTIAPGALEGTQFSGCRDTPSCNEVYYEFSTRPCKEFGDRAANIWINYSCYVCLLRPGVMERVHREARCPDGYSVHYLEELYPTGNDSNRPAFMCVNNDNNRGENHDRCMEHCDNVSSVSERQMYESCVAQCVDQYGLERPDQPCPPEYRVEGGAARSWLSYRCTRLGTHFSPRGGRNNGLVDNICMQCGARSELNVAGGIICTRDESLR